MTLQEKRKRASTTSVPDRNRLLLRNLLLVLLFVWMFVIFVFSSRDDTLSSQDSYIASTIVSKTFVPGFNSWTEDKQDAFIQKIHLPVRKTAHATEYAILASIFVGVYWNTRWMRESDEQCFTHDSENEPSRADRKISPGSLFKRKQSSKKSCALLIASVWGISVASSFLYACTDEFHQLFTGGRSGEFKDVCIDTGGAAAGAAMTLLLIFVCSKLILVYREKKK